MGRVAQVETAVSIDQDLFADAEAAARDLHISRSRLYALSVRELLERHACRDMMGRLNAVHDAPQKGAVLSTGSHRLKSASGTVQTR